MPLSGHFVVTSPGHPALIDPLQLGKMGHTKGHITVATDSNRRFFSARPCAHVTIHDSSSSSRAPRPYLGRARLGAKGVGGSAPPPLRRRCSRPPPRGQSRSNAMAVTPHQPASRSRRRVTPSRVALGRGSVTPGIVPACPTMDGSVRRGWRGQPPDPSPRR